MRAVVMLCLAVLAIAPPHVANGQPVGGCAQIVKNLNDAAAAVNGDATNYWAHRARFVDLIFGQSRETLSAAQNAEQEKSQADAVKAGVPGRLASFKGLLTAAQAQGCLSPSQLAAIAEPTIKLAKRVNFDQFPPEESPLQSTTDRGPPQMPRN
jgi:hypothetical protein